MTTYKEALDWLYGTQLFGIKLGLENITKLLDELEIFSQLKENETKILHVAGTNGKGSVCAFSDQILRDAGLKVGLFTSPHLIDFTERIQVNGTAAEKGFLQEKLSELKAHVKDWETHPTFFELTLALALLYFCEQGCEIIILETGMGGRLDATNALKAEVSVITQISLDHQQWLGNSIREIAAEKAGILKAEVPAIVANIHPEARDVVGRRALELGIPYIEAHPLPDDWNFGLVGEHQKENAALAVEATCRLEDEKLTLDGIRQSLENTRWSGRFQRLEIGSNRLILDGAHNEGAAQSLAATWVNQYGQSEKATLIFGAAKTKDVVGIFSHLSAIIERVILVPIKSERRLSPEEMTESIREVNGELEILNKDSIGEAIDSATDLSAPILVAGSLFLVGETLSHLKESVFEVSEQ